MGDAFGRALLDEYRGDREQPLYQRDGDGVLEHPVGDYYFGSFDDQQAASWLEPKIAGPLLDVGAGAGRDSLFFQSRYDTVGLEISEYLVTLLDERGVETVVQADMRDIDEMFPRDRFQSVLLAGAHVGATRSITGLRAFLGALETVTTPDGTVVLDGYDPTFESASAMLGYRRDPTPGLAHRVFRYEYGDVVGETRLLRLFSPDRIREATMGTGFTVREIRRPGDAYYYRAALRKAP